MASFTSGMSKHPETDRVLNNGISNQIIMHALMTNSKRECIAAVNGFN